MRLAARRACGLQPGLCEVALRRKKSPERPERRLEDHDVMRTCGFQPDMVVLAEARTSSRDTAALERTLLRTYRHNPLCHNVSAGGEGASWGFGGDSARGDFVGGVGVPGSSGPASSQLPWLDTDSGGSPYYPSWCLELDYPLNVENVALSALACRRSHAECGPHRCCPSLE